MSLYGNVKKIGSSTFRGDGKGASTLTAGSGENQYHPLQD